VAQTRADERALAALHKRLEKEKKHELAANRRAEAESAAADVLRAGIAAEEALGTQTARTAEASAHAVAMRQERLALKARLARLRPRRRALVAGALAIALAIAAGVLLYPKQIEESASGEPLKLRLDYRLTSARTPG
jgi:hypothetical protein